MNKRQIEYHSFGAPNTTGKRVIIFGGIHGNEPCGTFASQNIINKILKKDLVIKNGFVTFVPISNPRAQYEQKRFSEQDLNRIFKKSVDPSTYEADLANTLCELVDVHDVVLDIHSSFTPCPPHAFVDYPTKENLAFAKSLNITHIIYDWPKVYEHNPFSFPDWTTDRYAHDNNKIGIVVECGQHSDNQSILEAEGIIVDTLKHFSIIECESALKNTNPSPIYMDMIFKRDSIQDNFEKEWTHLDRINSNELIATRENGEQILAPYDGYILFPKTFARAGDEWFYFASDTQLSF